MGHVEPEDEFYETYARSVEEMARRRYRENFRLRRLGLAEADFVQGVLKRLVSSGLRQWLRRFIYHAVKNEETYWMAKKRQPPVRPRSPSELKSPVQLPSCRKWGLLDEVIRVEEEMARDFNNRWRK